MQESQDAEACGWEAERLRLLYDTLALTPAVTVAVAAVTAAMLWPVAGPRMLVWLAAVAAVGAARTLVRARWIGRGRPADGRWHRTFVAGAAASGVVWGSASLLIDTGSPHWPVLGLVVVGMAAGGVPVLAPSGAATLAYVAPVLAPMLLRLALERGAVGFGLALLGLVYLGVLLEAGRRIRGHLRENVRLRLEVERREQALRARHEELEAVLAHSRHALALLDADGAVMRWNGAGEALGGRRAPLWEALPWAAADRETVAELVAWAAAGVRGEREVALDGEAGRRVLSLAVTPVRDGHGAVALMVAEGEDVTSVRRAADEAAALNRLLAEALSDHPMEAYLRNALEALCQVPWLALMRKGAVFLAEDGGRLRMAADWGLEPALQALCAEVPFGCCLCGRAAAERRPVYAACVDARHERRHDAMEPHGHYVVPILARGGTAGVLLLYLPEGHRRDAADEGFLRRVAGALALGIERRRTVEALAASRQRLALHVEQTPLGAIEWDTALRVRSWNPAAERIFGYTAEEAVGRSAFELIVPERVRPEVERIRRELVEGRGGARSRNVNATRDGREILCDWFNTPLVAEDGTVLGIASLVMDVTEQVRMERALRESERRFRNLVERSLAGVYIVRAGRFAYVNPRLAEIFGYTPEEIVGREVGELVAPADRELVRGRVRERLEGRGDVAHYGFRGLRKDGTEIRVEVLGSAAEIDGERVLVGTLLDVTEQHRYEERIRRLANYDPLTELPNRRMLRERFVEMLEQGRRLGVRLAVLYLDLDRFKDVNDTLGHEVGDRLLAQAGERLRGVVRNGDLLARLGGDEFAAVLWNGTEETARSVAERVQAVLEAPFRLGGREVRVGASIGIARFPEDGDDVDVLLRRADIAMYRAKRGRLGHAFYHQGEEEAVARRLTLEEALRRAFAADELELHYQPRVEMPAGRIRSLEALVRWRHPERGLVPPGEFITAAEEGGLIGELDRWVREAACRQLARWQGEGIAVPVAVNVSAVELRNEGLAESIGEALRRHGVAGRLLEVEITESAAMEDPERSVTVLGAIKAEGVAVSIDDFGTGYSSLSYLKRLPADHLKIDRSFVAGLGGGGADEDIVRAIIAVAGSLGLEVIAEGVETEAQERFLLEAGCRLAQGYRYGRPVPAAEMARLLRAARGAGGEG
ncbi:bifunctional diguanylate cyclase/phosphodiesterase [Inmirania thermothiophila]|uniref:cyclic-guanylate-specific phosphodiesterase n=1 Tax=Inmirania thermothiophila TaxID=1750597 RepID=A0A3N1Y472_9GAMM|nr:EAL domain-containing protein [Inmirania thermothiophila]ROR32422.1 PAS domain S-box-containing protein/diguanylate cyclase (GGDEF)-like protein [Inmirania thermothiophila]